MKLPTPEIVTCETEYGAAYGWKIEAAGLLVIANTRLDCCLDFERAHFKEYGRNYGQSLTTY